jgi:hypothetical protein
MPAARVCAVARVWAFALKTKQLARGIIARVRLRVGSWLTSKLGIGKLRLKRAGTHEWMSDQREVNMTKTATRRVVRSTWSLVRVDHPAASPPTM